MQKRAKNEVFGHFLQFGTSDRLDIAYFECTKWSERFDHHFNYVSHNEGFFTSINLVYLYIYLSSNPF